MADPNTRREVSLGCGTLVVIALIVWFFSGAGRRVEDDVTELRREVSELKVLVQTQTAEIRALREQVKP